MSLLDPLFYIKNISAGRKNNMNILKTSLKISGHWSQQPFGQFCQYLTIQTQYVVKQNSFWYCACVFVCVCQLSEFMACWLNKNIF